MADVDLQMADVDLELLFESIKCRELSDIDGNIVPSLQS